MAGIFERIATITKANVNELLDRFEDPEKLVDQTIADAKVELAKTKKDSLSVLANEKLVKGQMDEAAAKADEWHKIAAKALTAGNEEDARKALQTEERYRSEAEAGKATYLAAKTSADKIREKLREMEDEIRDMEQKAAQIKAKAVTAKAIQATEKISSRGIDRGAFDAFDRMEEKANKKLAEAETLEDLNQDASGEEEEDLRKKYAGSGQADTDDALAKLKAELGL
ncbi:MAG: PspA/IM30 family protein [Lachnospiraceae bacterium]|jgi:phage shock protein A